MTRGEVQEKIRYNERLVIQFQNQVNDLQRRISSSESQIRSLNSQRSDYIFKANKLKKQIEELSQLKKKYQSLQTNFSDRQSKRISKFNANFSKNLNVKFINSYISGMKTLLSGSEYKKAYNGLTTAKDKITKQISIIQQQFDDVQRRESNAQKEIDNIQRSISSYRNQINTANSNLSYRRQRITYWRNQLQFATN